VLALPEPVALTVHLEDVDVVSETIEEGTGETLGAEHAGPLVERQIAGDDDRHDDISAVSTGIVESQLLIQRNQKML
jgi:hypothetical protein